jgi:hypothetical protein
MGFHLGYDEVPAALKDDSVELGVLTRAALSSVGWLKHSQDHALDEEVPLSHLAAASGAEVFTELRGAELAKERAAKRAKPPPVRTRSLPHVALRCTCNCARKHSQPGMISGCRCLLRTLAE